MTPKATIIILNYNTRDLTLACLAKFYSQIPSDWRVIVVDNASSDGSADAIEKAYPAIDVIRSAKNLGFSGGNNLGIAQADTEALILLNSDVYVDANTLAGVVQNLLSNPIAAALSPKLLNEQREPQAFAYGNDPTIFYLLKRAWNAIIYRRSLHDWDIKHPIAVDWISGACLCVKKAVVDQVGMMDDRFFLYFEDNDWCLRMREHGWRVIYDPHYQVIHLGGSSEKKRRKANQIYYNSLILFYKKHYTKFQLIFLKCFLPIYRAFNRA